MADYRIDYDRVDVVDLMEQVRARARAAGDGSPSLPRLGGGPAKLLRERLDLDDREPYEIQQRLELAGGWNISPEDLRRSRSGPVGALISAVRRLARPLVKLFVNLDEPLHKQFKVNLGIAAVLHELMQENAALRERVEELARRLDDETSSKA